jgi:hypothetical protein
MGSFYTNVQVRTQGHQTAASDAVARALRDWIAGQGYQPTSKESDADRSVAIVVGEGWISVYDQGTEDQDLDLLEALACRLSQAAGMPAVGILVHDSDMLELRLCAQGQVRDRYSSWPDYFEDQSAQQKERVAGQPQTWSQAIDTLDQVALETVFQGDDRGAERVLRRVTELLGMKPERTMVGHRYLPALEHIIGGERAVVLHFRLIDHPQVETVDEGPPAFTLLTGAPAGELGVGDPLHLMLSVAATGGAGRGVVVTVRGSAVASRIVEIHHVQIRGTRPGGGALCEAKAAVQNGLAELDFDLPGVPKDALSSAGFVGMPSGAMATAVHAAGMANSMLILEGRVLSQGHGELEVSIAPLDNPNEGGRVTTLDLTATKPPRRPRKALELDAPESQMPGWVQAHSKLLRTMETPRYLFALIALGVEQRSSTAIVTEAFERWNKLMLSRGSSKTLRTTCISKQASKPAMGELRSSGLGSSEAWKQLTDAFGSCMMISASSGGRGALQALPGWPGAEVDEFLGRETTPTTRYGFSLHAPPARHPGPPGEISPHVGLWMELGGSPVDGARPMEEALATIVDDLVARGEAPQAAIGRWSWTPDHSVEMIPYEQCCGIHGQVTTRQAWVRTYLRLVTPRLWLGPTLWERLESRDRLDTVAEARPVGAARQLVLRDGRTLDDLEEALDPLLPTRDCYRAHMASLYRGS